MLPLSHPRTPILSHASALTTRYDRDIVALAVPALGTLAVGPLVSLVDTAFVGQLGRVPLAALGVNASVFALAFIVFNFLAYATTPRVAGAYGRGDLDEAGRAVVQALTLAAGLGLVATLMLQAAAPLILRVMGASGELLEPALAYLRIRALGGPAVLIVLAGHGAFRGYQDTRTPLYASLALNLVNAALDPLLIFVLDWGLAGAATATAVAQWTGAGGFLWLLLVRRREALGVVFEWPRLRALLPFVKTGWTLASRTLAVTGTMALATAVAARIGTAEVAAHQVAAQLWSFLALVVDALAVAAQALVARYLGEEKPDEARAVSNRLLVMSLGVGAVLGLSFWLTQPFLPGLFTDDPVTTRLVLMVFPFVALMQPLNAVVFVGDGVFLGLEDFSFLAWAMAASAASAAAVLLAVVPMGWGLEGVWWGIVALMALRAVTLGARYGRARLFERADVDGED